MYAKLNIISVYTSTEVLERYLAVVLANIFW